MDKRKNRNEGTNSKECIMRYVITIMVFIAALMGFAKKAEAQYDEEKKEPCWVTKTCTCTWTVGTPDKGAAENDVIAVNSGTEVVVTVVTDAAGSPKAPDGWTASPFVTGACGQHNPKSCGAHQWRLTVTNVATEAHVYKAPFAVENAECVGNTRVFTITVNPAVATWTHDEKKGVVDHVETDWSHKIGVDIEASYMLVPNYDITTRYGHGVELAIGWRPNRGVGAVKLAGAFRYADIGIPISPLLRPGVVGTSEDYISAVARVAWSPQIVDWFDLELGAETGWAMFSYDTTFARQTANGEVQFVMEDKQNTFVLGPHLKIGFRPWKYMELFSALNVPVALVKTDQQLGPENPDNTDTKKVYALPVLVRWGVAATF